MSDVNKARRELTEKLRAGDVEGVRRIVTEHPYFRTPGCFDFGSGETILHVAAGHDNPAMLQMLVELGMDVNTPMHSLGYGPISSAAAFDANNAARWLLERGAKVNTIRDGEACCDALATAVRHGNMELVKLIVDHGGNINAHWGDPPMTPLSFAIAYGQEEVEKYLRSRSAKLPEAVTPATATQEEVRAMKLSEVPISLSHFSFKDHGALDAGSFSADGRVLGAAFRDKTVWLCQAATGNSLRMLTSHEETVLSIALSADCRLVGTGTGTFGSRFSTVPSSGTASVWDVQTGSCLRTLPGHEGPVRDLAFSPDGRMLATASKRLSRLWDVQTGTCLHTLAGHEHDVSDITFSPDGRTLASCSHESVRLWNVQTGECLCSLDGHDKLILSVAFSLDGRTLASGGSDGTIRLWDIEARQIVRVLTGKHLEPSILVFSGDGNTLISESSDKTVRMWDVQTGKDIARLQFENYIYALWLSPNGGCLRLLDEGGNGGQPSLYQLELASEGKSASEFVVPSFKEAQPIIQSKNILEHIEEHLGRLSPLSLQEVVPADDLPLVIHSVPPNPKLAKLNGKCQALVTNGMSAKPMTVPEGAENFRFAELVVYLPPDWPLNEKALEDPKHYWPIDWLRRIARWPYQNKTWLGGQYAIIANGEPPAPLGPNVRFTCWLVMAEPLDFGRMRRSDGSWVVFYGLYPLYSEERDMEKEHGVQHILTLFQKHQFPAFVNLARPNLVYAPK